MNARSTLLVSLRVLFGILCIPAAFMLMLSPFMFDNPAATKSPLAYNLAFAPVIYIALFVISLVPFNIPRDPVKSPRAEMLRALLPLAGIAWYGVAFLLLQTLCDGRFACKYH
jgi:hypothetical protein